MSPHPREHVSTCWCTKTDVTGDILENSLVLNLVLPLVLSVSTTLCWRRTAWAFLSAPKHQSRNCWTLNNADSQAVLSGVQILYHLLRCVLTTSSVTKTWIWPFTWRPSSFAAFFSAEPTWFQVSSYSFYPDTITEEKHLQVITFCLENWSSGSLTCNNQNKVADK